MPERPSLRFVWAFRPETLAEERWQPGDAAPEWRRAPGVVTITTGPDSRQTTGACFDHVLGPSSSEREVFRASCVLACEALSSGASACLVVVGSPDWHLPGLTPVEVPADGASALQRSALRLFERSVENVLLELQLRSSTEERLLQRACCLASAARAHGRHPPRALISEAEAVSRALLSPGCCLDGPSGHGKDTADQDSDRRTAIAAALLAAQHAAGALLREATSPGGTTAGRPAGRGVEPADLAWLAGLGVRRFRWTAAVSAVEVRDAAPGADVRSGSLVDLLDQALPRGSRRAGPDAGLRVCEDESGVTYARGARQIRVTSAAEAAALGRLALGCRREEATSPSGGAGHCLLTVTFSCRAVGDGASAAPPADPLGLSCAEQPVHPPADVVAWRFTCALLGRAAEPERGRSGGGGFGATPSGAALSDVTASLLAGRPHVPFRSGPLTRILSGCFGPGCVASFLFGASPSSRSAGDTRSLLRLAARITGTAPGSGPARASASGLGPGEAADERRGGSSRGQHRASPLSVWARARGLRRLGDGLASWARASETLEGAPAQGSPQTRPWPPAPTGTASEHHGTPRRPVLVLLPPPPTAASPTLPWPPAEDAQASRVSPGMAATAARSQAGSTARVRADNFEALRESRPSVDWATVEGGVSDLRERLRRVSGRPAADCGEPTSKPASPAAGTAPRRKPQAGAPPGRWERQPPAGADRVDSEQSQGPEAAEPTPTPARAAMAATAAAADGEGEELAPPGPGEAAESSAGAPLMAAALQAEGSPHAASSGRAQSGWEGSYRQINTITPAVAPAAAAAPPSSSGNPARPESPPALATDGALPEAPASADGATTVPLSLRSLPAGLMLRPTGQRGAEPVGARVAGTAQDVPEELTWEMLACDDEAAGCLLPGDVIREVAGRDVTGMPTEGVRAVVARARRLLERGRSSLRVLVDRPAAGGPRDGDGGGEGVPTQEAAPPSLEGRDVPPRRQPSGLSLTSAPSTRGTASSVSASRASAQDDRPWDPPRRDSPPRYSHSGELSCSLDALLDSARSRESRLDDIEQLADDGPADAWEAEPDERPRRGGGGETRPPRDDWGSGWSADGRAAGREPASAGASAEREIRPSSAQAATPPSRGWDDPGAARPGHRPEPAVSGTAYRPVFTELPARVAAHWPPTAPVVDGAPPPAPPSPPGTLFPPPEGPGSDPPDPIPSRPPSPDRPASPAAAGSPDAADAAGVPHGMPGPAPGPDAAEAEEEQAVGPAAAVARPDPAPRSPPMPPLGLSTLSPVSEASDSDESASRGARSSGFASPSSPLLPSSGLGLGDVSLETPSRLVDATAPSADTGERGGAASTASLGDRAAAVSFAAPDAHAAPADDAEPTRPVVVSAKPLGLRLCNSRTDASGCPTGAVVQEVSIASSVLGLVGAGEEVVAVQAGAGEPGRDEHPRLEVVGLAFDDVMALLKDLMAGVKAGTPFRLHVRHSGSA